MEKTELFGRSDIQVFPNRPKSINQVLSESVRSFRNKIAIVDDNNSLTYHQLESISSSIAANLQNEYDISKGDRIAVLIGNRVEFPLMVFACAKLGAILVPINVQLTANEVRYILENSKPKLLISEDKYIDIVKKLNDVSIDNRLFIGGEDSFSSLKIERHELHPVTVHDEDEIFILYTSGTTGNPKGAIISHVNVIHTLMNYNNFFNTDQHMKTLIAVPIYHVTGLVGQFLHMCYVGGTSYCMKRYQNDAYIELVLKHQIDFLFNVPTIFIMLATTDEFQRNSFDFVRKVAFGGAPIYQDTYNLLTKAFPNAELHNAYGATETTSPATLMPVKYPDSKIASVGLPVGGAQIKVIDSSGRECKANEEGELYIRGPMVIKGYWDNQVANESSFTDGYWHSGDIGMKDEEGYFYIFDRKKDMINRGGENVFSIEVEDVLKSFPGVVEAAVIGVPDSVFGERVKAFVVGPKLNEKSILAIKKYCKTRLARYKVPEEIEVIDQLPRNASGKILKESLRK